MRKIKAVAVELQKIKLEPGDCLFVKCDTNQLELSEAQLICDFIQDKVPEGVEIIGYPGDIVEIQVVRKL